MDDVMVHQRYAASMVDWQQQQQQQQLTKKEWGKHQQLQADGQAFPKFTLLCEPAWTS
jgi:hypothetical protein